MKKKRLSHQASRQLSKLTPVLAFLVPGSYGDIFESSSLRPRPCSLSQGNLSLNWPRCQGSPTGLDSGTQVIRRTQTATTVAQCSVHLPVSRVCSTPHIQGGGRGSRQPAARSEPFLSVNSTEDLAEGEVEEAWLQSQAQPVYQKPQESGRDDRRPPPPYPGSGKPAMASSAQQPQEPPLWRLQRHEEGSGTAAEEGGQQASGEHPARPKKLSSAYSLSACEQDRQNLGEASWLDWQRERWQIWELLSTDNPDALPETLV